MNPENDNTVEFQIRPPIEKRFSKDFAKEIIHTVLNEELKNKTYKEEEVEHLIKYLAMTLKARFKTIADSSYKLVINVILGEQRAADVRIITRYLWDAATDVMASISYENDSIFCVATVYAVYFY